LLALGAGIIAGLLSWAGGEATYDRFKISDAMVYPPNFEKVGGYERTALRSRIVGEARVVVERRRTATAFGLLGLFLGLALGLVGGLAGGSLRTGIRCATGGGVLGAAVAVSLSVILVPLFFRYKDPESGPLALFLTHAAIFAGIGAMCGWDLGWALGGRLAMVRTLLGGLAGALLGTFVYETASSLVFPLLSTDEPIPTEWVPRLMAHLAVAGCTALIAGLAAGKAGNRPTSSTALDSVLPA